MVGGSAEGMMSMPKSCVAVPKSSVSKV
jgi:hypothetical protein